MTVKQKEIKILRLRKPISGLVWAAPALVLLTCFLVWPMLRTIWISFHAGSIIRPTREFIGLGNFIRLFTEDSLFVNWGFPPWSALFNTALWVLLFTVGVIGWGLLIAVLGDQTQHNFERGIKLLIFIPIIISFTAASIVFRLIFAADPSIGVVNAVWTTVFNAAPLAWLGNKNTVNFTIIAAAVWVWTALSMTLLSAAYKGIPKEIREAAAIDGSTQWQAFWRISFPMMMPTISVIAVTMIINAMKAVDLILIMTQGGPGGASRIIGFTVFWEIFTNNKAGYGSASAVILLVFMIPLMVFQLKRSGLSNTTGMYRRRIARRLRK